MSSTNFTYGSIVVMVLAAILPHFGINIGSDQLTSIVQGLIEIAGGLIVYFNHSKAVTLATAAGVKGL